MKEKNVTFLKEATKLLKERFFQLNHKTYHLIIREFVENDELDIAFEWLQDAQQEEVQLGTATYNMLLYELIRRRRGNEAIELAEKMAGIGCKPNKSTKQFCIAALIQTNAVDKARIGLDNLQIGSKQEHLQQISLILQDDQEAQRCLQELFGLQV